LKVKLYRFASNAGHLTQYQVDLAYPFGTNLSGLFKDEVEHVLCDAEFVHFWIDYLTGDITGDVLEPEYKLTDYDSVRKLGNQVSHRCYSYWKSNRYNYSPHLLWV